ncbi:hypothetical protein Q1695_015655 [Nippostrongylus brasiliensis]|nr:hypothetical protein Q1695_015655 [Nippostrongylus brasiliensis]
MLEHLTTQWKINVDGAEIIATEYNTKARKRVDLIEEMEKEEILRMIRTASKQKERITSIATRFIAMSLISKGHAKKAGIPKQQIEKGVRNTIDQMRMTDETLESVLNAMYEELRRTMSESKARSR